MYIINMNLVKKNMISSYIIYDYNNDIYSDERLNKIDYRYIFVQVGNEDGRYYAYIYKVARRKY